MNDHDHESLLDTLVDQIRLLAEDAGDDIDIDRDRLEIVLEAAGHNVDLAAGLYFDDYLATRAAALAAGQGGGEQDDEDDDEEEEEDAIQHAEPEELAGGGRVVEGDPRAAPEPHQPMILLDEDDHDVARRLEADFERAEQQAQQRQQPPPPPDDDGRLARVIARAREAVRRLGEQVQQNAEDDQVRAMAARAAEVFLAAGGDQNESVSVSDDESSEMWKVVGGMAAQLEQKKDPASSPKRKKRKTNDYEQPVQEKLQEEEDDDAYLSDSDWLLEPVDLARNGVPLSPPTDFLWGLPVKAAAVVAAGDDASAGAGSNVIADDDGDVDDTCRTGIPRTWLSAGFGLSQCTTGLVIKPPSEDDLTFFNWQQRTSRASTPRNALPPPYHCKSITALISVVTAMLYTGACVQGNQVSRSSSRRPFAELTPEERRREFEARLADALSALLLIAVQASMERKRKALKKRSTYTKPADAAEKLQRQRVLRRLELCPTCSWEQNPNTGDVRLPEGRDSDRDIQVATSYTNIQDLRAYVLSSMRSFTTSGGCALFLETILRIHGKTAMERMVRRSRAQAKVGDQNQPLIHCTCDERHKKKMEENPVPYARRSSNFNAMADTTPEGTECLSMELLSLLLTGKVHSTLQGWDTGALGFGMLTDQPGEVGRGLSRPDKPLWVLRGPTCYSTLWVDGSHDGADKFASEDRHGSVATMTHWNCWYGQRNKTQLRLVLDRSQWVEPALESPFKNSVGGRSTRLSTEPITLALLKERRVSNVQWRKQRSGTEPVDPDTLFTQEELDRVVANSEDQKFYPNKYQSWRYDLGEGDEDGEEKKQRAEVWKPFYRLTPRERLLVEAKLGPQIKRILLTRWPRATIDRLSPDDPPAIV